MIPLGPEYPLGYMVRGEVAVPRGDGIVPPQVAVRVPAAGRYRFTVELLNPKDHADKMGAVEVRPERGDGSRTAPVRGDRWHQSAELELKPGAHLLTLMPVGWKEDPLLHTLTVEKIGATQAPR